MGAPVHTVGGEGGGEMQESLRGLNAGKFKGGKRENGKQSNIFPYCNGEFTVCFSVLVKLLNPSHQHPVYMYTEHGVKNLKEIS